LDIQGFFDNIDHELLLKSVEHYCKDKWILLYIKRWLQAGIIQKDGTKLDRLTGTPQGGVISPLLANIYLHVVFDKWMEKNHPEKPFERYADDIIVHCRTENQAIFLLNKIRERMTECKLTLHSAKTKIINLRRITNNRYSHKFDFLGYTFKPIWARTKKNFRLMVAAVMSLKSKISVTETFRKLKIHKMRCKIEALAEKLNPILIGRINYYCKFMPNSTHYLWYSLNLRLQKWVKWQRGFSLKEAIKYLRTKWKEKPELFAHWKLVHP
jgi:group II intron reverse transcriptase/maturase